MAAVREPTPAEVDDFDSLANVFEWAKVKGNLACPGSRAGSLLRCIARGDWGNAEIEDVASVSPEDFDTLLDDWLYCSYDGNAELDESDFVDTLLDETPGPMFLGAARAMHHAFRIKCKIVWTRVANDAYDRYMVAQQAGTQQHQAPMILHAPVAPVTQTVNVATLMDTSKNKEMPIVADHVLLGMVWKIPNPQSARRLVNIQPLWPS